MIDVVILKRFRSDAQGTFGELSMNGKHLCYTCEDPWNDNKPGESCIPAGGYDCVPHSGTLYKNVWEVTKVPGRSAILIHNGNTIRDTRGCILVGDTLGEVDHLPAVLNSRNTLDLLRGRLPGSFYLQIEEAFDGV